MSNAAKGLHFLALHIASSIEKGLVLDVWKLAYGFLLIEK